MSADRQPFALQIPEAQSPEELRKSAGDRIFGDGLYRILTDRRAAMVSREIVRAYPDLKAFSCFATDWLGNAFAVRERDKNVIILEPGSAMLRNTRMNFPDFHTRELVHDIDAALEASFYWQWREDGNAPPPVDNCVGYRKPLFQGGPDSIDNLELIDMDVYWTVTAPYIARARVAMWAEKERLRKSGMN